MNKPCAKCQKTVYATEKLNCLDKIWHKACFKCEVCGLTLNMKNYKGYNKFPYCTTHYPTTKFTAVADTPENRRLKDNSQFQSQIKYHEQFEKDIKGKKIEVADDPETLRIKKNMQQISQVAYHNLIEDKAKQEAMRPPEEEKGKGGRKASGGANYQRPAGGIDNYDPMAREQQQGGGEPQQAHPTFSIIDPTQRSQRKVGSIHDYDPLNEKYGSIVGGGTGPAPTRPAENRDRYSAGNLEEESYPAPSRAPPTAYYPAAQVSPRQPEPPQPAPPQPTYQPPAQPAYQPQPEPPQQSYQTSVQQPAYQPPQGQPQFDPNPTPYQPPPQPYNPPPPAEPEPVPQAPPQVAPAQGGGPRYKAIYDYQAADDDEVTFNDGDIIINTEAIDEGWMYGTVERTGQHGMLPSNYVERA